MSSKLAAALEVLLAHSSIPHESEARDTVQEAIEEARKPKTTKPETKTEAKTGGSQ